MARFASKELTRQEQKYRVSPPLSFLTACTAAWCRSPKHGHFFHLQSNSLLFSGRFCLDGMNWQKNRVHFWWQWGSIPYESCSGCRTNKDREQAEGQINEVAFHFSPRGFDFSLPIFYAQFSDKPNFRCHKRFSQMKICTSQKFEV